jgi:hypothetical protein
MLDSSGKQLWQTELLESIPQMNYELAAAPSCDWLAAWVWSSTSVQLLRRDGSRTLVRLVDPAAEKPGFELHLRSMEISPDSELLAIGTERGRIFLVTRGGLIKQNMSAEGIDDDMPVEIEFVGNDRFLVGGWWTSGLITIEGRWLWHQGIDFARVQPSRDLHIYAGWFVPAHGPQGGIVGLLDSRGEKIWTREVWDPAAAIAPDGSFMAFSMTDTTDGRMPGAPPGNDRPEVWLVDSTGRELVHSGLSDRVEAISADGSCVLARRRAVLDRPYVDLVGLDKTLKESWRIPNAFLSNGDVMAQTNLLVQYDHNVVRAYRLPSCRTKSD